MNDTLHPQAVSAGKRMTDIALGLGFCCVCLREFYPTGGFLGNFSDESVLSTAMSVE